MLNLHETGFMFEEIVVVEDDDFTRVMVADSLGGHGFSVVGSFPAATQALGHCKKKTPWACVIDLHLGHGPTGLDLAGALRRLDSNVGIVILSSYEDPRILRANLPAAPAGTIYLHKRTISDSRSLADAVRKSRLSAESKAKAEVKAKGLNALGRLTDSQLETLRLLAEGLSNSEIARKRFVTEKSVELSISRLARTMGIARAPSTNLRVQIVKAYFESLAKEG